jgi:dGTP triphosphohydrolase
MEAVFTALVKEPSSLGSRSMMRIDRDGLHRVAADYVAGMTDSYLRNRFKQLKG